MSIGKSEPKPTAAVVLDKRRQKVNGTYPVRLRITYQRDREYYTIKLDDLLPEEWDKLKNSERLKDRRLLSIREKITEYEILAREVIRAIPRFSFERFEARYFADHSIDTKSQANDVYAAFSFEIEKIRKQGRVSTASTYETALNSLKAYKASLRFSDLTPDLLEGYEKKLLHAGRSETTVGIYLRNLRTLVNQAKRNGIITEKEYPFGKGRYIIPAARNVKKALSHTEIKMIYGVELTPGSTAARARDFWLFSYVCNGINVKDMCRLRWRDIDGDRLTFVRAKTERTTKGNQKKGTVILQPETWAIINRLCSSSRKPDNYIFPILHANITPQRERELVQYLTRSINKYMRRIAADLKIDKPLTTYTARHSFATMLKRNGASEEFISESLVHESTRSTKNYMSDFDDETKRQYTENLLRFD